MNKQVLAVIALIALVAGRQINQAGLNLVKSFEKFSDKFYKDQKGIKTIGYGHACHVHDCSKIKEPITMAQAEALLRQDLADAEGCVQAQAPSVNENQFAALVSFTFNVGCGAFQRSTLLKDLKARNYAAAANEFGNWNKTGGQISNGLIRRRAAEKALFLS